MMSRLKKGHWKKAGICFFLALFGCGLLFDAKGTAAAAQSGVILSMETIIPSLLPFFVLSGILLKLQIGNRLGKFADCTVCKLFGINRELAVAYLLGLVGGYPVGARSVCMLYNDGRCSKADAQRVLGYANNCGPAFILSVAGVFLFGSASSGALLYLIHITASVLLGILSRKSSNHTRGISRPGQRPSFLTALVASVKDGMISVTNVCAFVILFSVLIHIAVSFHLFDTLLAPVLLLPSGYMQIPLLTTACSGLCEVTCGIKAMLPFTDLTVLPVICSFLLGFGGLCVHAQTASVVMEAGLSMKPYMAAKLIHGLFAAILTIPLLPVFSRFNTASRTVYFPRITPYETANPAGVLLLYSALVILFSVIFYIISRIDKKSL